jgi:hypothetical protein
MADDFRGDIHTEGKVAVNGSIDGRIDAAGDHDWFRVFLQAGVKYRFETLVTSSSGISLLSPIMRLYDSNGQYIGLSNDGANDSLNAEFFFEPVVSGSYFVDVEQRDAVQITGTYTLSVTTDDFAAGTSTIGEVVPDKEAVAATIETVGDHDWFKVSLSGAHHFVLRESGASTGAGTLQDPLLSLMGFPPSNGTVETLDPKLSRSHRTTTAGRDAMRGLTSRPPAASRRSISTPVRPIAAPAPTPSASRPPTLWSALPMCSGATMRGGSSTGTSMTGRSPRPAT